MQDTNSQASGLRAFFFFSFFFTFLMLRLSTWLFEQSSMENKQALSYDIGVEKKSDDSQNLMSYENDTKFT